MTMKSKTLFILGSILVVSFLPYRILSQNYCPDATIVVGTASTAEEQSSTISSSQWDQNAHNLSAICRGELGVSGSVSSMSTCDLSATGRLFTVTDGSSSSDCSVGGGSSIVPCWCNGTSWTVLAGGGGGSTNTFSTIDSSSGTDPVADSSTDTLILSGTSPIIVTGDSSLDSITLSLTQNAGTDITSDLEEEAHSSEHNQGGADSISGESLASLCSSGDPLEGDGAGGIQCGVDDLGTDDQTASEVNITDSGAFFSGSNVEDALQEVGPTMTDARTPTSHSSSHNENGSDELLGENLGTACTDGQIWVANTTGGMACGNPGSASFTTLDGDYGDEIITSTYDMSGGTLQLPNSATLPTTACDNDTEKGRIYIDNDAESGQQVYICEGAVSGWVLSSGSSGSGLLYVRDQKASGTSGGASTATTWNIRTLNTTSVNTITGASLSSNQVTLPSGTYRIRASAPCFQGGRNKLRLRNITAGSTSLVGASSYCDTGVDASHATLNGRITVASSTTFELQHFITVAHGTLGLGVETSSGEVEVYAELWVEEE